MNSDKKCVFLDEFLALFTHPGEEEPPSGEMGNTKPRTHPPLPVHQVKEGDNGDLIVDESGVRAIIPTLEERGAIGLFKEESKLLRGFARDCVLTWPVSLDEVRAWAEMMGFEVAVEPEGVAGEEPKRRPGPKPKPQNVAAIDLAVRLHKEEGKSKEKAAYEAAQEFGVNEATVRRAARQRNNAS